jgi:FtsP/CotA-like multicopper oxidase with cupredoxin domain
MNRTKHMIIMSLSMLAIALCGISPPVARAIDETKIPHYYGPYPNWALSQLPTVTPGACSLTTDAVCTTDAGCPTGETCMGVTVTGGIKKFQDGLPGLCDPAKPGSCSAAANNLGQYIPLAVPDTTTFTKANGFADDADYYVLAVVQHRERMNSSLPAQGTLMREYVQLHTPANASWSRHIALMTDLPDGTSVPTLMPDGTQAYAVDYPHYLGPVIAATKDKPVRIIFYNLLPTGSGGNLFIPVDSTLMGSGTGPMGIVEPTDMQTVDDMVRNPECSDAAKATNPGCFKDNRAVMHLHGGVTPWISDGTPHQWITPAHEATAWPEGASVRSVPDMNNVPGVPDCSAANDGCMSYYYTNQQSARLLWIHDHSWGITRLNVYAGGATGYLISDDTEKKLIADGTIPGAADTMLLIIQDKTFVPNPVQMAAQDPTWDYTRWGKEGDVWYHHIYMPAQNPSNPSGTSAYGRWFYGPWFWPPAAPKYGTIPNPRYNMDPSTNFTTPLAMPCSLDNPYTWQYPVEPFCEPALIPGTPTISVGMEQFNDTPLVNGTAYPTVTLQPKTYRLRILNAANDRFFNFQWYVADATGTEVALNAAEVEAAQTDPNVFPTPDTTLSPVGPSWIQIGSEGGFLPAPAVIPNQPTTWITNPTRFDVGNVDKHSLAISCAERADVIVDFSSYAGKTLILYNDAPAAYPARVPNYDYYTGTPDLSPIGAPGVLPGYGPNTRTIMQVKVAPAGATTEFDLAGLQAAFAHQPDGSGVFESGQHPIIVGQAAYNSAYGTSFASSSWCNAPGSDVTDCDGFARISEQGGDLLSFNTLLAPADRFQLPVQAKALHDETNAVAFDDYGRMMANLGVEATPATPMTQNAVLYPFVNPVTELIDATSLPQYDVNITPISEQDGTQIWKITHNGVDTHPIHFHLYDVQVLNRVTWDNIILAPDANELGWKETLRVSPLEDTLVALRPVIPTLPFELPNSVRLQNPMLPLGSTMGFNNIDIQGNPTTAATNQLVNFGWEYMWHCHILSHEEMDMMRPVSVALPPNQPDGLEYSITGGLFNRRLQLSWNDNSINETEFVVQKTMDGVTWTDIGISKSPLTSPDTNTTGRRTFTDPARYNPFKAFNYQVVAQNTVGYGGQFPSMTASAYSPPLIIGHPPAAPSNATAALQSGPQMRLHFIDHAWIESGFIIERSTNGGPFVQIATAPARKNIGGVNYIDTTVAPSATNTTYTYRVAAVNAAGMSDYAVAAPALLLQVPLAPRSFTAVNGPNGVLFRTVILTWQDLSSNETNYTLQRALDSTFTKGLMTVNVASNATALTQAGLLWKTKYWYRIRANNGRFVSSAWVNASPFPITTNP